RLHASQVRHQRHTGQVVPQPPAGTDLQAHHHGVVSHAASPPWRHIRCTDPPSGPPTFPGRRRCDRDQGSPDTFRAALASRTPACRLSATGSGRWQLLGLSRTASFTLFSALGSRSKVCCSLAARLLLSSTPSITASRRSLAALIASSAWLAASHFLPKNRPVAKII